MITAIILAGGLGTRLASTVPHLPKALAPIQKRPFLDIILQQLQKTDLISKVILALGYRAKDIQNFIDHKNYSFPIEYSIELTPLGTGGALVQALTLTKDNTIIAMNGDSFFDLDFSTFYNFHRSQKGIFTIACREVDDCSRYGSIEIDETKRIVSFSEKSQTKRKGLINAGIYCFQKSFFSTYPSGVYSLEKDIFPQLIHQNSFAFVRNGKFIDIGTANSYFEAQEILRDV